jgi:hypothetical protein
LSESILGKEEGRRIAKIDSLKGIIRWGKIN